MYKGNKAKPKEFTSLDYYYLKGLIDNYTSFRKRKKRIYIGSEGWSYCSGGNNLVLTQVEDELHLYPYRSWELDTLLKWLPNGELHLQNYNRLLRIQGSRYFTMHLWRRDKMPIKNGDVYLHGVPQPPASLVPEEHITLLEEKAKKVAAELLPPQTNYYWTVRSYQGDVRFRLMVNYMPPGSTPTPRYSSRFHHQMSNLYKSEGMKFPEARRWCSYPENTPNSYTEAILMST